MAKKLGTVSVVGLGYIGLPTAAFFAQAGLNVIGVDVNQRYVDEINAGRVPFFEPGFASLLTQVVSAGHLKAQAETPEADAYVVAVPTPFKEGYEVDDKYIVSAARGIADKLKGGELLILESTSPPGLTERMGQVVLDLRPDLTIEPGRDNSIYLAHCPERVLPGKIMEEMANNDRIIGGVNDESTQLAVSLYETFVEGEILRTDARTAEMAKLTENSFRDVNIAFANELSVIASRLGIDVFELIELANHHPRVNILQPGCGVGGHCIAVDPWFIVSSAPEEAKLIRQARETNDCKPQFVIDQVEQQLRSVDGDRAMALLGIAFKPDIDDLRESPALAIAEQLGKSHPDVEFHVVEPNIEALPSPLNELKNLRLVPLEEALEKSQLVVLLVDHTPFKTVNRELLAQKKVVDTRGVWR